MNISPVNDVLFWLDSPKSIMPIVVGQGSVVVFSGCVAKQGVRVSRLSLAIGDEQRQITVGHARDDLAARHLTSAPDSNSDTPEIAPAQQSLMRYGCETGGFWMAVPVTIMDANHVEQVDERHFTFTVEFSDNTVMQSNRQPLSLQRDCAVDATVVDSLAEAIVRHGADTVICLASYNPPMDTLTRQLTSISEQTYKHWVCVICDDASSVESQQVLHSVCASDSRFVLATHRENVGFYRNFERALSYVPDTATYVALSDQDDRWYPEKLQELVDSLSNEPSALLTYSDMRVVDAHDGVVANTYWENRHNNYTDPDIVLLANTVTGAAALMRVALLRTVLPFPERVGDAFHDHWIACCALSTGPLRYIDKPLYDYYQYDSSVIGHCDFSAPTFSQTLSRLKTEIVALIHPATAKRRLIRARAAGLAVHNQECRRLELIVATLKLRVQQPTISAQRAWRLFGAGVGSGFRLLWKTVSVRARKQTTNNAEVRLGMGYLIAALDSVRIRIMLWKGSTRRD